VFGEQVRMHRLRRGLSQEDLAGKAGVDPKTIRSIEAGRRTPRPSTVRQLADALGLDGPERMRFCVSTAAARGHPPVTRSAVLPAQLPPDVPGFVGRGRELGRLDRLLPVAGRPPPAVPVAAVSGAAGVGKTSLGVHWAHRVAARFPDGQLYVNLRGFDPAGRIMAADEAVRIFLDALGVPAERVPAARDAQVGLYRSMLAGKRMLIVLDNARDAEQVRPLLPGGPTAMVLVTSRDQLTPLVAAEGADHLALGLLSTVEARELLTSRLGAGQVSADPEAVEEIATACARLPLALAIAAARARQSDFPLTAIAAELHDAGRRLDILDAGDDHSQIRTVFSWSYTTLAAPAARLFRLLGLHPGPDISLAAVASLAGRPLPEARRLLTELVRANLVSEHAPGRYAFHDLLRAYATDLVHHHDSEQDRHDAVGGLLDHYVHTAHAADRLLHPGRDPMELPLGRPPPEVVVCRPADRQQAAAWLGAERPALLAALRYAADNGFDGHAWQIGWATDTFLTRRGYRHARAEAWQTAIHAARRLDDRRLQAYALRALAVVNIELIRYDDAYRHAQQALDLYGQVADLAGQGRTHRDLAFLRWRQGDPRRALRHAQRALALFQAAGNQCGIGNELNSVGWYHAELGNHAVALAYCRRAVTLLEQLGDLVGVAQAWDSVGYAHHHLGQYADAVDSYHRAMTLNRQLGDRNDEADTLTRLGDTHQAAGHPDAARAAWRQALDILTDLDHPGASAVRAKLDTGSAPAR
jgi:tetratricopeptide (TPR) repeat protein/DNA-binding XRE family transcriptional regulator